MGEWWYRQEYECEFSQNVESFFDCDEIIAAPSDDVAPLFEDRKEREESTNEEPAGERALTGLCAAISLNSCVGQLARVFLA